MEEQGNGGPAFPVQDDAKLHPSYGMTLRDWFAGQAISQAVGLCRNRDGSWDEVAIAITCYSIADTMLAERDRKMSS